MKFKTAIVDTRFSRESGRDFNGRYIQGITYHGRRIDNLYPGQPLTIIDTGPEYSYFMINHSRPDNDIDAEIFINGRMIYAFSIKGHVTTEYNVVRFYADGFYYILEYRFLSRENS